MSTRATRATIVHLYAQGHHVTEIAQVVGVHRATVYNNLKAAGVTMRDDRHTLPGVARKTHCKRGHAFTEENTRVDLNGSRSCRMCAMLRDYVRNHRA